MSPHLTHLPCSLHSLIVNLSDQSFGLRAMGGRLMRSAVAVADGGASFGVRPP